MHVMRGPIERVLWFVRRCSAELQGSAIPHRGAPLRWQTSTGGQDSREHGSERPTEDRGRPSPEAVHPCLSNQQRLPPGWATLRRPGTRRPESPSQS